MTRDAVPFTVRELPAADAAAAALFRRAFGGPPPGIPRHFVAIADSNGGAVAGYVHYRFFEPGVYLIGGLCVDARQYRKMPAAQRESIAREGSLARWLSRESIAALGAKKAVFAYTGDVRSRRDALALGFQAADHPYLMVQWHDVPAAERPAIEARVAANGPF